MKCIYCLKETSNLAHTCKSQTIQPILDENKEKIVKLLNEGYATSYIAKHSIELLGFETTNERLMFFCKRHSIQRRTISEAAKSSVTRSLYKDTVSKKYGDGITNVSQSNKVKEKKKQVNLGRYGVENPFQRPEIKNKIKESMIEKYGVENPIHISDRKNWTHYTRLTKPHKKISEWLTSVGIEHLNDIPGKFRKFNKHMNRQYCPIPDIFIPDKNIIIEIYGDRWHMNPTIFKGTDIVRFFIGERTALQTWTDDKIREDHLREFVNDVIIIWESDIKRNFESVKLFLEEKLCNN